MNVVLWLLTIEVLGLIAIPFAYLLFPVLKDRGFGFAKPLGMLLLALPVWWLGSAHFPLGPRETAAVILLALALAALVLARRQWPELVEHVRGHWQLLLATEAVFLLVFAFWALMRASLPDIGHTEQPMDFAFLNASMIAPTYPPEDPWLAGHGISYYYFGYLTMGLPGVLAGIPSGIVYNLAMALVPAMAAMGVVSLVSTVAQRAGANLQTAFGIGLLGVVMLAFVGNLEGIFEMLRAWGVGSAGFWQAVGIGGLDGPAASASFFPNDTWWWWRSSRVIGEYVGGVNLDATIQEYPFFSWHLGDLHPHVMSLPFILVFLGFCYAVLADDTTVGRGWWWRRWPVAVAMGLALGALGFVNAWDLPVFFAIGAGAIGLRAFRARNSEQAGAMEWAASFAAVLLLLATLPYLPYYLGAIAGQTKGIAAVTTPGTSLLHFLTVWGLFVVAVAVLVLPVLARSEGERPFDKLRANGYSAVGFGLGLAPLVLWLVIVLVTGETAELVDRLWVALPLSLALGALLAAALAATANGDGAAIAFTLGAAAMGVALVLGPELFYVVDFFDNRMNTVFKLYYQAWAILAVAAPLTLYFGLRGAHAGGVWRQRLATGTGVAFVVLALSAFYLPVGMAFTLNTTSSAGLTLDGTAFLKRQQPGEYAAIQWLKDNAEAGDVIVEAVGDDYTTFGRVASFTGLPSPLNWPGHELQWRGSSDPQTGRTEDVAALYNAEDSSTVDTITERYGVRYVVVGPRERGKYGVDSLHHLAPALTTVFSHGDVEIYAVTGDDA